MTTPQTTPEGPKKKNCFLWGCLIILVLICLVFACLVSVVGLSFAGIDPLGLKFEDQIDKIMPWQDYYEEPSGDSYYEDKDSSSDNDTQDPSIDSEPDSGSFQLVPFPEIDFPFSFSYPASWVYQEDDYSQGVSIYDLESNTFLAVGQDWICNGCSTAADTSLRYKETMEFQSTLGTFEVIENAPFVVSTMEDAYFNAYEWIDLDGVYRWAYNINIISGEYNVFFIMEGDDPENFDMYRYWIQEIGASYSK